MKDETTMSTQETQPRRSAAFRAMMSALRSVKTKSEAVRGTPTASWTEVRISESVEVAAEALIDMIEAGLEGPKAMFRVQGAMYMAFRAQTKDYSCHECGCTMRFRNERDSTVRVEAPGGSYSAKVYACENGHAMILMMSE